MTASCPCGRRWQSLIEAHCTVCHAHFSTADNFDKHKPNRTGCADPASHRDGRNRPFLKATERAGGVTWVGYSDRPAPQWADA